MKIEVINYSPYSEGVIRAFIDIFIPSIGMEIFGCVLCERPPCRWINLPRREYFTPAGERAYREIIRFRSNRDWKVFHADLKKAIDEYKETNGL